MRSSSRRISFGTQWVETMSSGKTASGSVASAGIHSRMAGHGGSIGSKVSMSNGASGGGGDVDESLPEAVETEEEFDGFRAGEGLHWAESAVAMRALEGVDGPDGFQRMWDTHSFDHQSRQKWVSQIHTREAGLACAPHPAGWVADVFSLLWRTTARAIGGGPLTVVLGVHVAHVGHPLNRGTCGGTHRHVRHPLFRPQSRQKWVS